MAHRMWNRRSILPADVKTVWAELSDPERLYRFSPLVTDFKPAGSMAFACDGLIDDIGLEWTDIIEVDPVRHRIVQRATDGFWNGFIRHWTIEPNGQRVARNAKDRMVGRGCHVRARALLAHPLLAGKGGPAITFRSDERPAQNSSGCDSGDVNAVRFQERS